VLKEFQQLDVHPKGIEEKPQWGVGDELHLDTPWGLQRGFIEDIKGAVVLIRFPTLDNTGQIEKWIHMSQLEERLITHIPKHIDGALAQ
jgi:hypothetical protein